MIAYIGRRFLWIIPVLFTVSVITFFLFITGLSIAGGALGAKLVGRGN